MKKSSKSKVLTIYGDCEITGETTFFFNGDTLITAIDGNDGNYREEYMNCLFNTFGVKVIRKSKLSPGQNKSFLSYCNKHGIEIPEKNRKEATEKNFDYFSVMLRKPFGYQDMEFFIKKDMPLAKEFISAYKEVLNEKDVDLPGEMKIKYYFKEDAIEKTKESSDNYKTANGYLGYCNKVTEIIHPKSVVISEYDKERFELKKWKTFSDVAQYSNFYYYLSMARCFKFKGKN